MAMKSYCIFIKKNKETEAMEDVILVKGSFNFNAMFFNIFWFLYHKMWICFSVSLLIFSFANLFLVEKTFFVFLLVFLIFIGLEANNLLLYNFKKGDYFFAGYSLGNDEKEAKVRFLDNINKENRNNNKVIY